MKKTTILALLLWISCVPLFGQTIKGTVVDHETSDPLYLANVVLLSLPDSTFVTGTVTDEAGCFSLPRVGKGACVIRVSYLGYSPYEAEVTGDELGVLRLSMTGSMLGEVKVTATRPYLKPKSDGVAVDIANSHLKNLGAASDVLAQLPFVTSSGDGITVFGKGTPLIYIDNREVRDVSELDGLNSNDVKRVEVITNPGPRYKASVKSVIRIETVRKRGDGLSGNLYAGGDLRRRMSDLFIGNLNYRAGGWDLFGTLDFRQTRRKQYTDWDQQTNNPGLDVQVRQSSRQLTNRDNLTAKVGSTYAWGESNSLGVRYEYRRLPSERMRWRSSLDLFENGDRKEERLSSQSRETESDRHYVNAYYYQNLAPKVTLKADADWAKGISSELQQVNDRVDAERDDLRTDSRQDYDLVAARLSFDTDFGKAGTLSYGGEYSYTNNRQEFVVNESYTEAFRNDQNTSRQHLLALYTSYQLPLGAFSIEAGIRYERADFAYFENEIRQEGQSRLYNDFFSNLGLSYAKGDLNASLSFGRSIVRPNYYQLRNSIRYNSAYAYEAGNPYLLPTIDNSLSALLGWKGFLLSANLDIYKDASILISRPYDERILLSVFENFDDYKNLSASLFYSTALGVWKPSASVSVSKDFFSYGTPERDYDRPIYSLSWKNNFVFPHAWQAGVDLLYVARGDEEMSYMGEQLGLNIYVSKRFFDDRLRVNLRATDLFGRMDYEFSQVMNNVLMDVRNDLDSRGVFLSLSYYFNQTKSKYKGKPVGNELRRL